VAVELPLFPLPVVLFPDGPLPLRIFEPRYLAMVSRCSKRSEPFVVTLVTGRGRCASVGTTARIVDFGQGADRMLTIAAVGEQRVRILGQRTAPEGFALATVEPFPPTEPERPAATDAPLIGVLRELLPDDEPAYRGLPRRWDDAGWIAYRLAEQLPLDPTQRQALLEAETVRARLDELRPVAEALGTGG
jgi:hypothetical protein